MVGRLIEWAMHSRAVVILLTLVLAYVGGYAFVHVNVEAYPDPAPAIIEVVAQYPGASAEEVERQVTIPLEVALAGMPGLQYTRTKSMFGLAHVRNQFAYGIDHLAARQEVLNRLATAELPANVKPMLSPASPIGEIFRYTLNSPRNALGKEIYTSNDLKSLQDWTLERRFLRIPGVAGVVSCGGTVKRYEIQPDPQRLKEYGITLQQLEDAVKASNANASGNFIVQAGSVQVVRGIGLIGGGQDPLAKAMNMPDAEYAADYLRREERRRVREIRRIVIAATNNIPIRVEHVVKGGPVRPEEDDLTQGVVIGHLTRQGQIGINRPKIDRDGKELVSSATGQPLMEDEDDKVQGIILLRKNEKSIPVLQAVREKIEEFNHEPGRLLPGVFIEPYYNRSSLIEVTTETVRENLLVGVMLVAMILLMFLGNVRTALIVAINIPLALLFAFAMLYLRGKSANLLSIGAVDFGIIVDSSVIMVENIFRRLTSGEAVELHLKDRVLRAAREVERSLFYSTLIMVCALLPLFTMQGPEGQIFGPMADTYAFALAGALLLAFTLSPVLCGMLFGNLRATGDNFVVHTIKAFYLKQLHWLLEYRWATVAVFAVLVVSTAAVVPFMGREFMPELEEGNLVIRGTFPVNVSLDEVARNARWVRRRLQDYPEIKLAASQIGRPDDGTDPTGFYELQLFVPLQPRSKWPVPEGHKRQREKFELVEALDDDLSRHVPGVNWDFSQIIRDNVMESLSGVKGENSVKIIGPELDELENLAVQVRNTLSTVAGVSDPGIFRIQGQTNLSFPIDREKCALWGVNVADVEEVIETAVGGAQFSQMLEGERRFDIALRWPAELRRNADDILNIPVDVVKNTVTEGSVPGRAATPLTGPATGLSALGTSLPMPSLSGSIFNGAANSLSRVPRRRLGDLVTPMNDQGERDPEGSFVQPGAATISREDGRRLIAVKFGVRGRDLASTVAEAQQKIKPLLKTPYTAVWSGEFQQMQEAERRMLLVVSLAMVLIVIMLYLAFYSLLDASLVLANVVAMSLGGLWTLLLAGLHFNVSAAVGFISILGVAVMEGMILVSSFNGLRAVRMPVFEAIIKGTERRIRPVTMTALTAILGLLPAAFSDKIGSESQKPLAIVVVGGMVGT
ncbi:MAG: efflux RND transporter permease subunit, partial [Planctomycetia bacterium]|nr:efflux RND transporter permease subunit [Planctomycetia bacterium]